MTTAHLHVKLRDGTAKSHVTVLFIHVDCASSGIVAEENTKVLHVSGFLFVDLAGGDDLSLYAADLVLALHVIPELGTGENLIPRENADAVQSGLRVAVGR